MIRKLTSAVLLSALAGTFAASPSLAAHQASTVTLNGAGSTFDEPFFTKAFSVYARKHPIRVNYQGLGSGAGIKAFIAGTVDFGASDVPMAGSDLAAARAHGGAVRQVPIALGGVSLVYNVPGVKDGLKLSRSVLADIYLGKLKKWNDGRIRKLNKGVKLPSLPIIPTVRSDGSGTTYIFTDYLSSVSSTFASKVGVTKQPSWPGNFPGGLRSEGVAALVRQTAGTIGYVELAYALQNHMKQVRLQNRAGKFVKASRASVAAAASRFPHVNDVHFHIVNAKGPKSYPIAGYSWVLLYKKHRSAAKGKALVSVMRWLAGPGQKYAAQLRYVPLPANIVKLALSTLKDVK